MQKPVRIAVIGSGRWGKNIIRTLREDPRCVVAYIETGGYKKLLKHKDVDAVVVATPGSTHAQVALPFIKLGLPVFIEKPFTTSLVDAQKLLAAAKKSGSQLFVGHLHLYNSAYLKTKELSKKLGKIRFLYGEGSNNGPYRDDMSALWDWAPHDVVMMLDLVGNKPHTVKAWGVSSLRPKSKLHDVAAVELTFPGNIVGMIFNSWLFPEKRKKLTVVGTKSSIVYDDTAAQKVTLFEGMGPLVEKKGKVTLVTKQDPAVSYPTYAPDLSLTAELAAFVRMVKTKKHPKTDGAQGLAVVEVLDAAECSIRSGGRPVRIKK